MLVLLSPSKTLDFESKIPTSNLPKNATPVLLSESLKLIEILKKLSEKDIAKLMDLSPKLAKLNFDRFQSFQKKFTDKNSKTAIFAFKGDVYEGLDVDSLSTIEVKQAQNKIAILSGLYGLVRPLDLIQPYRLEMGTNLKNSAGNNLYKFWNEKISNEINQLEKNLIINLASNEYFKAVAIKNIKAKIVDIDFKEFKSGEYKTIGIFAKKARGLMARYIIQNNISKADNLKDFNLENYKFNKGFSNDSKLVFTR
jgi:cytoplasmic iron level regulating protein YaaA (DUF328/UPF0246 family)